MPEVPVACRLSQAELGERKKVLAELSRGIVERRKLPDGLALRCESVPGVVSRLGQLVELERACCPFIHFRIVVEPANGPVWLELTGPPDSRDLLEGMLSGE